MTTPTPIIERHDQGQLNALAQRALERISVAPPYFALGDLAYGNDGTSLVATIGPCPPQTPEVGATEAAQVARHLAILGSCAIALASENDQRHHYLAMAATYERVGRALNAGPDSAMTATAVVDSQGKREASASMTLHDANGEELNRLQVTYAVMKPRMFQRLNPPSERSSTLVETTSPLIVESSRGCVTANYGPVPVELCAGHFPDHPVAPIALVMGRLVRTARDALCSHLGADVFYRVEGGSVEASGLAQPGQELVLEARHLEVGADGTHTLAGRALADGIEVGAVRVTLAAVSATDLRHDG